MKPIYADIGKTKIIVYSRDKEVYKDIEKSWEVIKKSNYIEIKSDRIVEFLKRFEERLVVGFPGMVKKEKEGYRLVSIIKYKINDVFRLRYAINDVKAFAYYHAYKFFKNRENRDKCIFVLQIGTGVNGMFLNYYDFKKKQLFERLVEFGHFSINFDGEICECGRKGCLERYIGGKYINKKVDEKFYLALSSFLSSIILSLNPSKIVLGGGVCKGVNKEKLVELIEKDIKNYSEFLIPEIEISLNKLDNIKGLILLDRMMNTTASDL